MTYIFMHWSHFIIPFSQMRLLLNYDFKCLILNVDESEDALNMMPEA